jgi:hypothetical protein
MFQTLRKLTQKIKQLFQRKTTSNDVPNLEVAHIVDKFNLLLEAARLARLGLPAFHAKTITAIEQEVVHYIETAREQIQRQTQIDLHKMDLLLEQARASQFDIKISQLTTDFERQAIIVVNEQNAWLEKLANQAQRKTTELDKFRTRHHLDRDAVYPEGAGLFMRYAFLLLLVVFEGVFNASFFAEGLSTGLLGGFVYSAMLSAINVVVMFLLGKTVVRWFFHVSPGIKTIGVIAATAAVSYTLMVGLSVAHLRAAIILGSATPTQAALHTLLSSPIALDDMMSWVLFLVTSGFGLAAMMDGLFIDDLYPGYGDITRREISAVEEFEEEFDDVRANLDDIRQENLETLDQEIIKAHQIVARFRQIIDDKKTIFKSWQQTLDDSETALYAVLRIFRAENTKYRHDGMRPAYFDTLPSLTPVALEKHHFQQDESDYSVMMQKLQALESDLQSRREKIHQSFDQHVQRMNFIKHRQPHSSM